MTRRKPPRKPTEVIQTRQLHVGPGQAPQLGPVMSFKLPEEKNEAETAVMDKFSGLCVTTEFLPPIIDFYKYPSDHGPDFIIKMPEGRAYAELVEIASLSGPYSTANHCMNVGDYLDYTLDQVRTKIAKYEPKVEFRPIYLIMYVSHYGFSPDIPQTRALRRQMQAMPSGVFKGIYLVLFAHDGNPTAVMMWPFKGTDITRNQVRALRRTQMVRPDLSQARIIADASSGTNVDTTVRVMLPLGTDMRPFERMVQKKHR
jgi:hypothetical protein